MIRTLLTRLLLGSMAGFCLVGCSWIFGSLDHAGTTAQLYRALLWGALCGFIAAVLIEVPPFLGELRYRLRRGMAVL